MDSNSLKVALILPLEDIAFHSVLLMIGTTCHVKLYQLLMYSYLRLN